MKRKIVAVLLVLAVFVAVPVSSFDVHAQSYFDVEEIHWFYNAVSYVSDNDFFSGTGNNMFSPHELMTRGMFVTVLGRFEGVEDQRVASDFDDVNNSHYFAAYVDWALDAGITTGIDSNSFGPDYNISRQDMITMFYRYAEYKGLDTSVSDSGRINDFPDGYLASSYAKTPMNWALENHIISGDYYGNVEPTGLATRAETAQILYNASSFFLGTTEPPSDFALPQITNAKANTIREQYEVIGEPYPYIDASVELTVYNPIEDESIVYMSVEMTDKDMYSVYGNLGGEMIAHNSMDDFLAADLSNLVWDDMISTGEEKTMQLMWNQMGYYIRYSGVRTDRIDEELAALEIVEFHTVDNWGDIVVYEIDHLGEWSRTYKS